jgi:hypothetical protein
MNLRKRAAALLATLAVIAAAAGFGATPALAATTYHYAVGSQVLPAGTVADGAAVNITVESPLVSTNDGANAHSIGELIVQSDNLINAVEVGWRKGAGAGQVPKLFVYHRINGVGQGYNNCTDYAPEPVNAGADLSAWVGAAASPRFQITATATAWWIAFNAKWVCHIPISQWTNAGVNNFAKASVVQAYGEVASTSRAKPCSDMGNGQAASSGTAARIGSYSLINPVPVTAASFVIGPSPAGVGITTSVVTPGVTFRYGWAGYTNTGTLPGNIGAC